MQSQDRQSGSRPPSDSLIFQGQPLGGLTSLLLWLHFKVTCSQRARMPRPTSA